MGEVEKSVSDRRIKNGTIIVSDIGKFMDDLYGADVADRSGV